MSAGSSQPRLDPGIVLDDLSEGLAFVGEADERLDHRGIVRVVEVEDPILDLGDLLVREQHDLLLLQPQIADRTADHGGSEPQRLAGRHDGGGQAGHGERKEDSCSGCAHEHPF